MKKFRFHGTQVKFPDACVCCLGYAHKEFKIERTFVYGRKSILLQLPVPMCDKHYAQAIAKSPAQTWCQRIGVVAGIGSGLAAGWGLMRYWSATGQGSLVTNILLALFVGISAFVTVWAILHFWLAPLFASAETKSVIHSVRMTKYDPFHQVLELEFVNDSVAELTAHENLLTMIPDVASEIYHISAHLQDDDIRMSCRIETNVLLDHHPTVQEARHLLQPVIDRLMVQQMGQETFYEVSEIEVSKNLS
jgi:hypothetical protein